MYKIYNYPNHIQGDTFNRTIKFNFDITGATIKMHFILQGKKEKSFGWSTEDNTITITNALTGIIELNKQVLEYKEGVYDYDCQIEFANGTITTYFGGTLTIIKDITE